MAKRIISFLWVFKFKANGSSTTTHIKSGISYFKGWILVVLTKNGYMLISGYIKMQYVGNTLWELTYVI